jgi:hypothetical protein
MRRCLYLAASAWAHEQPRGARCRLILNSSLPASSFGGRRHIMPHGAVAILFVFKGAREVILALERVVERVAAVARVLWDGALNTHFLVDLEVRVDTCTCPRSRALLHTRGSSLMSVASCQETRPQPQTKKASTARPLRRCHLHRGRALSTQSCDLPHFSSMFRNCL